MRIKWKDFTKTEKLLYFTASFVFFAKMIDFFVIRIMDSTDPFMSYFIIFAPLELMILLSVLIGLIALIRRNYPRKKAVRNAIIMNAIVFLSVIFI